MTMQQVFPILPMGFRFHPTDEELVVNYLQRRAIGQMCPIPIIADVDIYNFNPWELPSVALFGEYEWYFFTLRDHKYPNSVRSSRSAASGFWKATGTDKPIQVASMQDTPIAMKKALVFYVGRPPMETKTTWIMHEYRLTNTRGPPMASYSSSSTPQYPWVTLDEWVLCKIFSKAPGPEPNSNTPPSNVTRLEGPPAPAGNPPPPPPPPPAPVSTMNGSSMGMLTGAGDMLFTIQEEHEQASNNHQIPMLRRLQSQSQTVAGPITTENSSSLGGTVGGGGGAGDHGCLDEEDTSAYTFSDQEMERMLMDLMDQDFFGDVD